MPHFCYCFYKTIQSVFKILASASRDQNRHFSTFFRKKKTTYVSNTLKYSVLCLVIRDCNTLLQLLHTCQCRKSQWSVTDLHWPSKTFESGKVVMNNALFPHSRKSFTQGELPTFLHFSVFESPTDVELSQDIKWEYQALIWS